MKAQAIITLDYHTQLHVTRSGENIFIEMPQNAMVLPSLPKLHGLSYGPHNAE